MLNIHKFNLNIELIADADQRVTRIVAEHSTTGQVTTVGLLFTGDKYAHETVQGDLQRLADSYGLPRGHWHRLSESDGVPTYCPEPDPDGQDAWLMFAADFGVPRDQAELTLLAS